LDAIFGFSFTTFADERLAAAFFAAGFERAFFVGFFAFFLAIELLSFGHSGARALRENPESRK
jgi:hypothetical protein